MAKLFEYIRTKWRWYPLVGLSLIVVFIWFAAFREDRQGLLTVAFLDVGQGDAIFVESPSGNQVLIDSGPNQSVLNVLGAVMPFYDRSIDMIIETHPDTDHSGGLPDVVSKYKTDFFLEDGVVSDSAVSRQLASIIGAKHIKTVMARQGMRIDLGKGAYMEILSPTGDTSSWDTNTASVVARLVYGKTSFLLTGDAPKNILDYLAMRDGKSLKTDVLKVAHHGSSGSLSESFFGFAAPAAAVISVGADNRYGHPNADVLDSRNRFGIKVLRTDELSTVVFRSDGEAVELAE